MQGKPFGSMRAGESLSDMWSKGHSDATNSKIAMCRVYATKAEERTCSIKTFGSDLSVANADYADVQWLSPYTSPDGDEISMIPRIGSLGVCCFVDAQPWIIGFFQPTTYDDTTEIADPELEGTDPVASSAAMNKEKINDGDFIFRAIAGNRLVIRAGGEIEIEATKVCRRTYFPTENLISELCQNYEFRADGGTIDWKHWAPDSDYTKSSQVWRTDVNQSNIIVDERGTVELDNEMIWRYRMGSLADFKVETGFRPRVTEILKNTGERSYALRQENPIDEANAYETLILPDGEYSKGINDFGFYESIKPTGEYRVNINDNWNYLVMPDGETTIDIGIESAKQPLLPGAGGVGKYSLNIKPTGETTLKINEKFDLNIKDTGETTLKIAEKVELSIKDTGETLLDVGPGKAKVEIQASGELTIDVKGNMISITPGGEVTVTATTKITLDAPQIILGKQGSPITTVNSHLGVVDLITGVPVIPSISTFGDI